MFFQFFFGNRLDKGNKRGYNGGTARQSGVLKTDFRLRRETEPSNLYTDNTGVGRFAERILHPQVF